MRSLVVHVGGIGDFLLACPAIRRLSDDGPVEVLGRRERALLAVTCGFAEAAHDLDAVDFASAFAPSAEEAPPEHAPSERLQAFLSPFDRAIVWMKDAGQIATAFRQSGVDQVIVCPGLPPSDWTSHASAYYLSCLGFADNAQPGQPLLKAAVTQSDDDPPSYDVIIHPGSGGARKNWPLERFLLLAERLDNQGRTITWSRGPAEEDIPLPQETHTMPPCSLTELAARLARTRLYIGNDSGITHLAAAVGCPSIAIFGPTDPRIWAPLGPHVKIVQATPWPDIETVLSALPPSTPRQ